MRKLPSLTSKLNRIKWLNTAIRAGSSSSMISRSLEEKLRCCGCVAYLEEELDDLPVACLLFISTTVGGEPGIPVPNTNKIPSAGTIQNGYDMPRITAKQDTRKNVAPKAMRVGAPAAKDRCTPFQRGRRKGKAVAVRIECATCAVCVTPRSMPSSPSVRVFRSAFFNSACSDKPTPPDLVGTVGAMPTPSLRSPVRSSQLCGVVTSYATKSWLPSKPRPLTSSA